jgi:AcrR family transcriptional regulator
MNSPSAPPIEWVKPARQARSQRTLERILDAAETMILETGSDGFTVADVAKRGRSSVGSLYARFPGKEALLRSVFERFLEQAEATVAGALEPTRWRAVDLGQILDSTIAFLVHAFYERRPLIAALTVRASQDAEVAALAERLGTRISMALGRLIAQRSHELHHPNPERAVRFATWLVLSAMEAHTLQNPCDPLVERQDIMTELTYMCRAYLGIGDEPGQRITVSR